MCIMPKITWCTSRKKVIDDVTYYLTKWFDETHFYKKIEIEDEALEAPLEFTEKVAKFSLGDFNDMFAFTICSLKMFMGIITSTLTM